MLGADKVEEHDSLTAAGTQLLLGHSSLDREELQHITRETCSW